MDSIGPFHSRLIVYLIAIVPYLLFAWAFQPLLDIAGLLVSGTLIAISIVLFAELLWSIKPSSCYLLSPDGISKTKESSKTITTFKSISPNLMIVQMAHGVGACLYACVFADPSINLSTRAFVLAIGLDMTVSGLWFLTQMSSSKGRFRAIADELNAHSAQYGESSEMPYRIFDLAFVPHGFGFFRLYISSDDSYKESIVIDGKAMDELQQNLKGLACDEAA